MAAIRCADIAVVTSFHAVEYAPTTGTMVVLGARVVVIAFRAIMRVVALTRVRAGVVGAIIPVVTNEFGTRDARPIRTGIRRGAGIPVAAASFCPAIGTPIGHMAAIQCTAVFIIATQNPTGAAFAIQASIAGGARIIVITKTLIGFLGIRTHPGRWFTTSRIVTKIHSGAHHGIAPLARPLIAGVYLCAQISIITGGSILAYEVRTGPGFRVTKSRFVA